MASNSKRKHRPKAWVLDPARPVTERGETLYTVKEAADYLGVTERWIRTALARRYLPRVKIGKYVKFRKADLDAYIESQRVPAAGER
jgi:excisionase family DNA binding protein